MIVMGDLKSYKMNSLNLLNIFHFQNDFKYKFCPDSLNDIVLTKDKLCLPKPCNVLKNIYQYKKLRKRSISSGRQLNYFKRLKKVQDEQCVSDALQEATVLEKISTMKKNGIWTREALPKVMEPNRNKGYWDFVLEEFEWLAIDRINRLHWKISAARIIAENAKTYVLMKDEIKSLEFLQLQDEARLHCSRISNMIKAWFSEKQTDCRLGSIFELPTENSSMDICQYWISSNLISSENNENSDYFYKSDSESLCSFNSTNSHTSVMLSDDHFNFRDDLSIDFSDGNTPTDELIDELNWLECDIKINETETNFSFEKEINELKILSQIPLEKIIDENYFNTDQYELKSESLSEIDLESVASENTDTVLSIKPSFIVSQSEKIQNVLNIPNTEMKNLGVFENIFKNESFNRNFQVIYELIKIKCSFSILSSMKCGDDRLIISVLLSILPIELQYPSFELIVTNTSRIYEWKMLFSALSSPRQLIIFDSYVSLKDASEALKNVDCCESSICIISYSVLPIFNLASVKWSNIIYDQIEKICEYSSNTIHLSTLDLYGARIGLISEHNDLFNQEGSSNIFLRLFYSSLQIEEFINEIQHSKILDKLTVLMNHCIPLEKIFDFEHVYKIVMCKLSPFQNSLHKYTLAKLRRSLETKSLLNSIEAICQDIQLSQHPFCFESYDNEETEMLKSLNKQHYLLKNSTYFLPNSDILSIYLPRKVFMTFLTLKDEKYSKSSNCILPHNNSAIFSYTKYERLQMKNLLISMSNIDNSMNELAFYLADVDDKHDQYFNKNINSNVNGNQGFLTSIEIDKLIDEYNIFNENEVHNMIKNIDLESQLEPHNRERDSQLSSTLAARRSKTKFKSRLTSISKENEKYIILLDCSDINYLTSNLFMVDINYLSNELGCLDKLFSITKRYIEITWHKYVIIQPKVIARSPKVTYSGKSKLQNQNENNLVNSISLVFQSYLNKLPTNTIKEYSYGQEELGLSGKLDTLNSILINLSKDLKLETCIIISHSFELLNLIEALIYINDNYGSFMRFRFSSYAGMNDRNTLNFISRFNKFQLRHKKTILLLHSRINYEFLIQLNIRSCAVVIADAHWQIDSDQSILNLINRLGLNCLLSQGNGISSIYKLCCLETLEQYFLRNDLSFLCENSYNNKDNISTTSAIICSNSIFKCFIDNVLSPIKEEFISVYCTEDLQKKDKLTKLSNQAVKDLLNSFVNPYDLLQLCHNQFTKNKFKNLSEYYVNKDKLNYRLVNLKEALQNWQNNLYKRQKKLKHLLNFFEDQGFLLFYDSKFVNSQNNVVWSPPYMDNSLRIMHSELANMYILKPLENTGLSECVIPTKNYQTKTIFKKWDEKNYIVKDELILPSTDHADMNRIKKRKLSNDFQMDFPTYPNSHQKKRKILSNRRYFTENEIESDQHNIKMRLKNEKGNDSELQAVEQKDILDIKKLSPVLGEVFHSETHTSNQNIPNSAGILADNKCHFVILYSNDGTIKINLHRPFYCKEGLKTLKIKRQHIGIGTLNNLSTKPNLVAGSNIPNYSLQQKALQNQRGQLFISAKIDSCSDSTVQTNGENEYEKLPEWNIHEEAVLYQNISHYQDHQFSINITENSNSLPNFKICEHYLNFYSITNTHRSNEICKIHFNKLQMGFQSHNKGENSLSRINRNSNLATSTGVLKVRTVNESRPVIGGVTGRKLKIKMKNSIGTYGTSIFGSTQAMTNKIKMFQNFLYDRKVNLTKTNQIVNSCLNSFDSKTTMTFKMLDEVVNTSKLPSLLPSHSQTIKKNATHISALEEHNIHPDKIFTPAMLIQRREDMDKESEQTNRQSSLTPISYRNFESNTINTSSHSLNHIRRNSSNITSGQNLYSLQTTANNQIIARARYNVPINRQLSGSTAIHQPNQNSVIASSSNSSQNHNMGCRSQALQFQIQHTRNTLPRKTPSQPVIQRLYPGNVHNFSSLRHNNIINRSAAAFVRPIIPTVVNQSNNQNTSTNNSIITVFPNSHDQNSTAITRTVERNSNFNLSCQIRAPSVRTNVTTVASTNRANQIPRMLHVNQINRNNININNSLNRNQQDQ